MKVKPTHAPVRIALLGAGGRMGRAILEQAQNYPGVNVTAALVRPGSSYPENALYGITCSTDLHAALAEADVLLDFSNPESTAIAVDSCVASRKPLVSGVTGLDQDAQAKLAAAAKRIAVLSAPNMSLGANLLLALTRAAAAALDQQYDLEITDIHHRDKRDAPSGTALALGKEAARGRGIEDRAVFVRHGERGTRQPGSIGFTSLRAGDLAGEHRIFFGGPAESLELIHRATSRAAFARGALAAARWIAHRPAGLYSMAQVLNLPSE